MLVREPLCKAHLEPPVLGWKRVVTEADWNHPSPLLPQVNSKGFFTLMQLHIVCVQHRHLTTPLQYLMIYTRKIPVGEVGFYFFGCLVLVDVSVRVCACAYVDFLGRT